MSTQSRKLEIADCCYENKTEFYLSCPAMAVEDALFQVRSSNSQRKPQKGDAIDLIHGVMALPYCDLFVTEDGFVRDCGKYVARSLPSHPIAKIIRNASDLAFTT